MCYYGSYAALMRWGGRNAMGEAGVSWGGMGILTQRARRTQREREREREGGRIFRAGCRRGRGAERELGDCVPVEGLTSWGCRRCKSGVKPPHSKLLPWRVTASGAGIAGMVDGWGFAW